MKKISCDSMIASWKIDSDEERYLAEKGDINEIARAEYADYYRVNDSAYYEKGLVMIDKTLDIFRPTASEAEKEKYRIDMIYSLHRFGCMYDEYFLFNFEHLNWQGRDQFVTDKNRWEYYNRLNTNKGSAIFNNKAETYKVFREFYKRDFLLIEDEKAYQDFCAFREKHEEFIVKPLLGSGGRGVYIERSKDSNEVLYTRALENGPVVIEELIQQSAEMAAIHPSSVNTVRIPTVIDHSGNVVLFHPFLREGVGDHEVDNAASGGIIALVDPETGVVMQKGITEHGKEYVVHPDSGMIIPGFKIPRWDEAVAFVKTLAGVVSECRYVGWDCALTDSGWIMVEGNCQGQLVGQYATKRGCKYELEALI